MVVTGHIVAEKYLLGRILGSIGDITRVLELGCGTGLSTAILAEILDRAEIVGLDVSERMLDIARERFNDTPRIRLEHMNVELLSHGGPWGVFDVIRCLCHLLV